ncbi:MAG: SIR2 family protein [Lewinellaceae bacterium]|nr:SIR2 family protein [Lewinellaceae bacterium]
MPEPSPDISKIVADLKTGNATLILGPELFDVDGVPMQHYVRQKIQQQFNDQIASYYERDGFFIIKNQDDKPEIAEAVADLYRDMRPNEAIFQEIIEIPFPLVVSVSPDTFLSDLAYRLGVTHRFSAFYPNAPEDIETPTREAPLFYNVAGCVARESSLLLDYDDLLRLLEGMLSAPKLPERLRNTLGDTKSFLFLGFQFDRWHTQLLLRLLNMRQAVRRIAPQTATPDDDTQAFLLNQFKIKFLGDDRDLLAELHQACADEGILRTTTLPGSAEQSDIIRLLQKGNVEKAVERLLHAAQGSALADDATMISGQVHALLKEKPMLDSRDFFPRQNKLADTILKLAKQLPAV